MPASTIALLNAAPNGRSDRLHLEIVDGISALGPSWPRPTRLVDRLVRQMPMERWCPEGHEIDGNPVRHVCAGRACCCVHASLRHASDQHVAGEAGRSRSGNLCPDCTTCLIERNELVLELVVDSWREARRCRRTRVWTRNSLTTTCRNCNRLRSVFPTTNSNQRILAGARPTRIRMLG
jgi:hypothetical protein